MNRFFVPLAGQARFALLRMTIQGKEADICAPEAARFYTTANGIGWRPCGRLPVMAFIPRETAAHRRGQNALTTAGKRRRYASAGEGARE
jgi:hypothetical protein